MAEFAALNETVHMIHEKLVAAESAISENTAADETQQKDLDVLWLLFGAYLVFFMQVSFPVNPLPYTDLVFPPAFIIFFSTFARLNP